MRPCQQSPPCFVLKQSCQCLPAALLPFHPGCLSNSFSKQDAAAGLKLAAARAAALQRLAAESDAASQPTAVNGARDPLSPAGEAHAQAAQGESKQVRLAATDHGDVQADDETGAALSSAGPPHKM